MKMIVKATSITVFLFLYIFTILILKLFQSVLKTIFLKPDENEYNLLEVPIYIYLYIFIYILTLI